MAISVARVRCERTVPIRGSSGNIFQRSSVIVTKRIHVDLTVSVYRRRLWKAIRGVRTEVVQDDGADGVDEGPLTKSDTLVLYSKFKQLVELNKNVPRITN